jgi:hypothetical protein
MDDPPTSTPMAKEGSPTATVEAPVVKRERVNLGDTL